MNVILAAGPTRRAPADALIVDVASWMLRRGGRSVHFDGMCIFRFVAAVAAVPGVAAFGEIEDAVWGDDAEGGPDYARRILFHMRRRTAKRLALLDLKVITVWGFGFEMCDVSGASSDARAEGRVAYPPPPQVLPERACGAPCGRQGHGVDVSTEIPSQSVRIPTLPASSERDGAISAGSPLSELSAGGSPGREGAAFGQYGDRKPDAAPVASTALPSLGVSSLDWGRLRLAGAAAPLSAVAPNPPPGS